MCLIQHAYFHKGLCGRKKYESWPTRNHLVAVPGSDAGCACKAHSLPFPGPAFQKVQISGTGLKKETLEHPASNDYSIQLWSEVHFLPCRRRTVPRLADQKDRPAGPWRSDPRTPGSHPEPKADCPTTLGFLTKKSNTLISISLKVLTFFLKHNLQHKESIFSTALASCYTLPF